MNVVKFPSPVKRAAYEIGKTKEAIKRLKVDKKRVMYGVTEELIVLRIQVLELKLEEDTEMIRRFTEEGVFTEKERDYILGEGEYK